MAIKYSDLGGDLQLNEIVVAGSHDAGITGGKDYVQTQKYDIGEQAARGVRVFDLRIAAAQGSTAKGMPKVVELKAYHGSLSNEKNVTRHVTGYTDNTGAMGTAVVTRSKMPEYKGAFGEGLVKMLEDAKAFVKSTEGASEYLILKFDKCYNWALIARACQDILGKRLYTSGGNLNTTKIKDLRGKVIVLFSSSGLAELPGPYDPHDGILKFVNLQGKGAYAPTGFHGLQYYGKGGTAVGKPGDKTGHNETKQSGLMRKAVELRNPQIVGMMYWTTTGAFGDIRSRNREMWQSPNVTRMRDLWKGGLGPYLQTAIPLDVPDDSPARGPMLKRFMPNIVMIDFADSSRCKKIFELNNILANDLVQLDLDGQFDVAEPVGYVKPKTGIKALFSKK